MDVGCWQCERGDGMYGGHAGLLGGRNSSSKEHHLWVSHQQLRMVPSVGPALTALLL
jgi:hypothetical protein